MQMQVDALFVISSIWNAWLGLVYYHRIEWWNYGKTITIVNTKMGFLIMKPQKQLYRHHPEKGIYGDCFRACVASITELDIHAVPHFFDQAETDNDAEIAVAKFKEWAVEKGYSVAKFALNFTEGHNLLECLHVIDHGMTDNQYWILTGGTDHNTNHAVVCKKGKVVFNPSDIAEVTRPLIDSAFDFEILIISKI